MSDIVDPEGLSILQKRQRLIKGLQQKELIVSEKEDNTKTAAFLFISFDLVNSTSFKSLHPNKWPMVFNRFYELVENHVMKRFTNSRVWRYAGDEILFYRQIYNYADLYNSPKDALAVIKTVTEALNSRYPETKNILYLKSTLWIAEATYVKPQELNDTENIVNNLIINFDINDKRNIDFLGADIDLGFRISQYAQREKVVVSAELAFLLYRARGVIEYKCGYDVTEDLRIVSYERLKGIWGERHYPIIWYHENWNDLDKMFFYDDHYGSEIVSRLANNKFTEEMKIKRLQKIFDDVDNNGKVEGLIELFKETDEVKVMQSVSQYNLAEVHCVAICFNDKGEILLGKRPEGKRRFPGIWEFGCGQLKKSQEFEECLAESYKEDFFAELDFFSDLTPVSTYLIEDNLEGRKIPGIMFIAHVNNPDQVEQKYSKSTHSEVKWFDPQKLNEISEDEYVDRFKDTVEKAVEAWKQKKEAS